jgi:hypothetical protein
VDLAAAAHTLQVFLESGSTVMSVPADGDPVVKVIFGGKTAPTGIGETFLEGLERARGERCTTTVTGS